MATRRPLKKVSTRRRPVPTERPRWQSLARDKLIAIVRRLAVDLARRHRRGLVTVNEVYKTLDEWGHPRSMFPGLSNIFRGREWKATPLRVKSRLDSRGSREVHVWKLAGSRSVRRDRHRFSGVLVADLDTCPSRFAEAVTEWEG